jgi:hypothetical protein
MLALNYDLARQMRDDGTENLNIDVYLREHFVPLPNSTNGATGRFVIPLRVEELLYLGAGAIFEMSKQPRPDDSFAVRPRVPEAAEWFAEALQEKEKHVRRQSQLQDKLLGRGVVPPCIRRLDWADMSEDSVLEACRILAGFYPFVGAGADEVWYHARRLDQRHGISNYPRLRNIVGFGNENPAFVGCSHPLLRQFCPIGGCLMNELINELKNPRLFA